jgi:hypothetical protein
MEMTSEYINLDLEVISKLKFERIEFVLSHRSLPFIDELREQFNKQVFIIKLKVDSSQPFFG